MILTHLFRRPPFSIGTCILTLCLLSATPAFAQNQSAKAASGDTDLIPSALIQSVLGKAFGNEGFGLLLDHIKASLEATSQDKPAPELDAKTAEKIEKMASTMKKETASLGVIAIDAARADG